MVDRFADAHPQFDRLSKVIEIGLRVGFELKEAYALAIAFDHCRRNKMPSRTPKQARTMRAAAHDKGFAKKMDIPQKVAREYVAADKRKPSKPKK